MRPGRESPTGLLRALLPCGCAATGRGHQFRSSEADACLGASLAMGDGRDCVGSQCCSVLPAPLYEARWTHIPKGRCKVGWVVNQGGRESFDVWLEVRTGLVKLVSEMKA